MGDAISQWKLTLAGSSSNNKGFPTTNLTCPDSTEGSGELDIPAKSGISGTVVQVLLPKSSQDGDRRKIATRTDIRVFPGPKGSARTASTAGYQRRSVTVVSKGNRIDTFEY